jgi:manganese transport protein
VSDAVARVGLTAAPIGMTDRTVAGIREVLGGATHWRSPLLFAGPAVVASIAYMDPGNFATNIQAGAKYGYALLWVVLTASLAAMLFQSLSAKLGIVTGRNLAEMCREHFPKPVVWGLWIVSEIAAMATDLAEFLGGAIGLSLLLHIPLLAGMGVTGVLTYGILMFEGRGFRPTELIIGTLVAAIALCYLVEMVIAPVDWAAAGLGSVVPSLPNAGAVTIAVGIVGATIMPHAIFLHSGLTQNRAPARNDRERRLVLRFSNIEVLVALGVAGLVNMAMVIMASSAFHAGHSDVAEIQTAYKTLTPLLGPAAAGAFLTALLASGLASSTVGTMAGQMIMQGFLRVRVPIIVRRLVTMIPAFVVVWLGVNSTSALIMSQVVLSIALPAPVIALLIFTSRKDIMGAFANSRLTNIAASFAAVVILTLNAVLLLQAFGVAVPGLPAG